MGKRLGKYYKKLIKQSGTTFDKIQASTVDPSIELTENQEGLKKRCRVAWSLLLENRTKSDIVCILMDEFKISESQGYYDINYASKLYGNIIKTDKEAIRSIHYQLAQKTFNMAEKDGDFGAMAKALQVMNELMGVNVDDGGLQDPETLKPSTYTLNIKISEEDSANVDLSKIHELRPAQQKQVAKAISNAMDPTVEDIEAIIDEGK